MPAAKPLGTKNSVDYLGRVRAPACDGFPGAYRLEGSTSASHAAARRLGKSGDSRSFKFFSITFMRESRRGNPMM